jgi:O-antigen/teichoic acid export membrane protein
MLRAALALGGASLVTQAVGVLLSPVYSRLYAPSDFGLFGVYNSVLAAVLTVGSLCYETGIPVGKDEDEAVGLTAISILLIVGAAIAAVAWLGIETLLGAKGSHHDVGAYLWLVPVGIVGAGVYRSVRYWALRRNAMGAIARTSVSQLVASQSINLSFGILDPSPVGLVLAGIAGYSAGTWGLIRRTRLIPALRAKNNESLAITFLWAIARKYKRLALVATPSTLFNSLGLYLPGIMLAPYFGADFAGQFFMGMRVIGFPLTLIGGALSQVFFSRCAAIARERPQDLASFFDRVFVRTAAMSLLVLLVGLLAPLIFPVVFGRQWRQAGEIAAWLSVYCTVGLGVSALSTVPNIVGRLQGQFFIDVARALCVAVLFYGGHRMGLSGMAVVKGYSAVMTVGYVSYFALYRHQVKQVARTGHTGWNDPPVAS